MQTVLTQNTWPTHILKRDGLREEFNEARILLAVEAAQEAIGMRDTAEAQSVLDLLSGKNWPNPLPVEELQDAVVGVLQSYGRPELATAYQTHRETRRRARVLEGKEAKLTLATKSGEEQPLAPERIMRRAFQACAGLDLDAHKLAREAVGQLYPSAPTRIVTESLIASATSFISLDPAWDKVAARLQLLYLYREVLGERGELDHLQLRSREKFADTIMRGITAERLDPRLASFNLEKLGAALQPENDALFPFEGAKTIYERYVQVWDGKRQETPQFFWMRVAMGLALEETKKEERALEFYQVISSFKFIPSTPTLFNAGTVHPQLSSCFLSKVEDDLKHIFKVVADNAQLQKWAGGVGNDWTSVRATGSIIKGTGGESQGVVPFLKVGNDTAIAVNQGGKRKGAVCAYLECWHLDFEDFLDLRKNTGDERRRTHDMNTAGWAPDLFMKRILSGGNWTLFSPQDVPDLHDLYGAPFEARYQEYEAKAARGEIPLHRTIEAVVLWRKWLKALFETGHPWITFKDPSNLRNPQHHAGVVHHSNLCTEILLNTSATETAVCNLGSVNLLAHVFEHGGIDAGLLKDTVTTAMRMLDNVIDINYYPTEEARTANMRHRPVGLGVMGFHDFLQSQEVPYGSEEGVRWADRLQELISFHAIRASAALAQERGAYPSFQGSDWSQGILPLDTLDRLEKERGLPIEVNREVRLDWEGVRVLVKQGMRNSHCLAIAPTATISTLVGVSQSIEPHFKNLFARSNLSGDFTIVNRHLVAQLKAAGVWDEKMLDDLKYEEGSVQNIDRIPEKMKRLFETAFEIRPEWLIAAAAARQKWIDMGQSLNVYLDRPDGAKLNDIYFAAWGQGLKTTYYLHSRAATTVEKSNADVNKRGLQPKWMKSQSASSEVSVNGGACQLSPNGLKEGCEACQ